MKNERIRQFPINTKGRDFVVGDIHGQWIKLEHKLTDVDFNPLDDRLFALGDLVDRSPHSVDAADWLRKPWFFSLLGNHEQMAIDCVHGKVDCVNYTPIGDGAWFVKLSQAKKLEYARLFSKLPLIMEVETMGGVVGLVHAEPQGLDWHRFKRQVKHGDYMAIQTALWGRARIQASDKSVVKGVGLVFVGHTVVKDPVLLGNVMYLDTGAVFGDDRPLTLAQLATPNSPAAVQIKLVEPTCE